MRSCANKGELTFRTGHGGSLDNWHKFKNQMLSSGVIQPREQLTKEEVDDAVAKAAEVEIIVEEFDPNIGQALQAMVRSRSNTIVLNNDEAPTGGVHNRQPIPFDRTQTWMLNRAGKFCFARSPQVEEKWHYKFEWLRTYQKQAKLPPGPNGEDHGWGSVDAFEWLKMDVSSNTQMTHEALGVEARQRACLGVYASIEVRNVSESFNETATLYTNINEDLLHILGNSAILPDTDG